MALNKQELAKLIGTFIRNVRTSKKISMEKLANDSGISYMQLSRIENGHINTSIFQVYIIFKALNIPIIKLIKLFRDILLWNLKN